MLKSVLIKLSGEALGGTGGRGIDRAETTRFACEIAAAVRAGTRVGIVVGGGNFLRGAEADEGADRITADYMGMLATVMNGLALREALANEGISSEVLGGLAVDKLCRLSSVSLIEECLHAGRVAIFTGGTGNPFFSTDSAAALRAAEMKAGILLKATKVDGVYDKDPKMHPDATRFDSISFDEAIDRRLKVMDLTAFNICRDRAIPIRVFNFTEPGVLEAILRDEPIGTLVGGE